MKMHGTSLWQKLVGGAEVDDPVWGALLPLVFIQLTRELAVTDMKDSVIPDPSLNYAYEMVRGLNEDELKVWKDSVKKNNWIDLLARPELKSKMPNITPKTESFGLGKARENGIKPRPFISFRPQNQE
ncbi:hypothetical protein F5887DRAFT_1284949 [Amanita rubescens]|nr:hypothetical protein F5887DRAFT_1284949 [Amanita rubescens]